MSEPGYYIPLASDLKVLSSKERDERDRLYNMGLMRQRCQERLIRVWYDDEKHRLVQNCYWNRISKQDAEIIADEFRSRGWNCWPTRVSVEHYGLVFRNPKYIEQPTWWAKVSDRFNGLWNK